MSRPRDKTGDPSADQRVHLRNGPPRPLRVTGPLSGQRSPSLIAVQRAKSGGCSSMTPVHSTENWPWRWHTPNNVWVRERASRPRSASRRRDGPSPQRSGANSTPRWARSQARSIDTSASRARSSATEYWSISVSRRVPLMPSKHPAWRQTFRAAVLNSLRYLGIRGDMPARRWDPVPDHRRARAGRATRYIHQLASLASMYASARATR